MTGRSLSPGPRARGLVNHLVGASPGKGVGDPVATTSPANHPQAAPQRLPPPPGAVESQIQAVSKPIVATRLCAE